MRKTVIVALAAIGSSLALYAGMNQPQGNAKKPQTECCDKTECCPVVNPEECCESGCE
ncbi:hypothetical protein [Fluviicola sp.]|jgi:hypothetical protein|uniref:hypothetical protein n=1 Tax=Fluviicola sp. TaxID=1917219 RepID=UPI002639610D|nr:hypothetical protein [Fluviicola sp.]